MGFFSTKVIAILAAIAIAAVGAWGGWQYVKLQKATTEAAQMKTQRDEAARARDEAIAANQVNQDTIDKLQQEKADIQASLNALEEDKRRNQKIINNLSAAIRAGANNPENQVKLSPVLKATVDAIQKQRDSRSGGVQ